MSTSSIKQFVNLTHPAHHSPHVQGPSVRSAASLTSDDNLKLRTTTNKHHHLLTINPTSHRESLPSAIHTSDSHTQQITPLRLLNPKHQQCRSYWPLAHWVSDSVSALHSHPTLCSDPEETFWLCVTRAPYSTTHTRTKPRRRS